MDLGHAAAVGTIGAKLTPSECWTKLKSDAKLKLEYLDVADGAVKGLLMGLGEAGKVEGKELDKEQKKRLRQQSREDLKSLNLLWLEEMTHSKAQLREKVALFLAVRFRQPKHQHPLPTKIVAHHPRNARQFWRLAPGGVKSCGHPCIFKQPAKQKQHPNENFAREVMELFTLGRGNYTENDIKEAARAFTGWGFQLNGEFVFRRGQHDKESKTILEESGKFDGDDVLNILLEQKQCARLITTQKAYRFFANQQDPIPEERLAWLSKRFYESGL